MRGTYLTLPFKTLSDVEYAGKRVLVRADLNCSLDPKTKEILDDSRIVATLPTLKELTKSKVVVMAHQGRPGDEDFTSLEKHVEVMKKKGLRASFVDDIFGKKAKDAIKKVKVGESLVLQNTRYFDGEMKTGTPEEMSKEPIVQELYPLFDLFANDAFGAAHRAQPSIVGFTAVLPSVAGRLVEKEIRTLTAATATDKHPWTLVLGGSKVEDKVKTLEKLLATGRVDNALLGGLVGTLFLVAQGTIPKEYAAPIKGYESSLALAKQLLDKYPKVIGLPSDAAVEKDGKRVECKLDQMKGAPLLDIGPMTTDRFAKTVSQSAVVFANGPMGYFEKAPFATGTEKVLDAIVKCKGVTIVGGGHMGAVAQMKGVADKITHISTGGGATINFLTGKKLELIAALEDAAKRMK